jgi:hypothetical protein
MSLAPALTVHVDAQVQTLVSGRKAFRAYAQRTKHSLASFYHRHCQHSLCRESPFPRYRNLCILLSHSITSLSRRQASAWIVCFFLLAPLLSVTHLQPHSVASPGMIVSSSTALLQNEPCAHMSVPSPNLETAKNRTHWCVSLATCWSNLSHAWLSSVTFSWRSSNSRILSTPILEQNEAGTSSSAGSIAD